MTFLLLSQPRLKSPAPATSYSGTFADIKVTVVHNGTCQTHKVDNIGTVPAGLTAYVALQEFRPDLVISAGTAGGFKAKVSVHALPKCCISATIGMGVWLYAAG